MLEISKNNVNTRLKDELIANTNRVTVSKKRQNNNIDPDASTNLAMVKVNSIPYEDLQNRITSIQVARDGLENSISILEKMKDLVYSDNDTKVESINKKRFDNLKEKLEIEKKQLEKSINELKTSKDNKILNKKIDESEEKVNIRKKGHLEFIKSLKSVPDLSSIHKGLTAEKVASLLS